MNDVEVQVAFGGCSRYFGPSSALLRTLQWNESGHFQIHTGEYRRLAVNETWLAQDVFDLSNFGIPASQYTKQMLMIGSTQLQETRKPLVGRLSGIMGLNVLYVMERSYRSAATSRMRQNGGIASN
ncbi:MAG: hypothetical protein R2778_16040 [Saprospiraceae bacterium]